MNIKQTRSAGGGRSAGLGTGLMGSDGPIYRDIGIQTGYTGGYHDSPDSTIARRHQQHAHVDDDYDEDNVVDIEDETLGIIVMLETMSKHKLLSIHDMTEEEIESELKDIEEMMGVAAIGAVPVLPLGKNPDNTKTSKRQLTKMSKKQKRWY